MRAFAAVFGREVFARRLVFPVAFASGFMPLVGSLSHGWSKPDAAEGRILVALVAAAAFAFVFAILFGGSVIAGDTSEKRISFFFSRPIPSAAIWSGKLLAVFFVVLVSAMLILAPALLTSSVRTLASMLGASGHPVLAALALPGALVLLILGAHAAVTVARLRSPWVALDLLLAPALVLLATIFLRSLARNFDAFEYDGNLLPLVLALAAAPALGLLVATFVQVAEGRTDARRAHGAFSAVFFGIVGAAVALLGGYAWWCASAKATDLVRVGRSVQTQQRGPWVAAGGRLSAARGGGSFLFDANGARSLRIHGYGVVFSADGTRAAWGEARFGLFERKDDRIDVFVADLLTGRAVATELEAGSWGWTLSPSGRRLAIRDTKTISAYDVSDAAQPRQLAAFPLEEDGRALAFIDEETLRLFPRFLNSARRKDVVPASLEITELSLPSKKSLVTGRFDRMTMPFLRLSADSRYLVGTRRLSDDSRAPQTLTLHDGRTGALIATLAEGLRNPQARFLTGGRIAVTGIGGARAQMKIFLEGEEGQLPTQTRTIDLGSAAHVVLGGEIAPGPVVLSLLPFEGKPPASLRAAKLAAVDTVTGAVSPLGDGLIPANQIGWWTDPVLAPAEAGAPWSLLFLDADNRLVRLDPATGARTLLLGRSK